MYRIVFIILLCLALSVPFSGSETDAATQVIEIKSDEIAMTADPALVRDEALGNALTKVVEDTVRSLISSNKMIQYEDLLREYVYARAKSYILNYSIIRETTENGLFSVTVRAAVAVESIKKDLEMHGVISESGVLPMTLILLGEQRIGDARPRYRTRQTEPSFSEVYLKRSFSEDGFPLVDRMTVADTGGYFGLDSENIQVAFLGRQCGAELVVVARSVVTVIPGGQEGKGDRLRAYVEGKALKTENGAVIGNARWEAEAPYGHTEVEEEMVLKDAVERMAATLRDRIRVKWEKNMPKHRVVRLIIGGIEHYADYRQVKAMVEKDLKGVKGVRQKRMERESAALEMEIERPILAIADELSVRAFNTFSLDIVNVRDDSIELTIIK